MTTASIEIFVGSKKHGAELNADDTGVLRRFLRGERMHTVSSTLDEFAAALQFPWYFGRNKDAFDECIGDLSWLEPFANLNIIILDGDQILVDEPNERPWFIEAMRDASQQVENEPRRRVTVILQVTTTAELWCRDLPAALA